MLEDDRTFKEYRASEDALHEAEALIWLFLTRLLDQRVRMTAVFVGKFARDMDEEIVTGSRPPVTRDSLSVLDCARAAWEARLDEHVDRWRAARVRHGLAYERYFGCNYQKHIEATAAAYAPLVREALDCHAAPAAALLVSATVNRLIRRATDLTPTNQNR